MQKITLKAGAIFIADAHFPRSNLSEFIDYIKQNRPPQVFLLGDIFDVFIGGIKSSEKEHGEFIKIIENLNDFSEIFYFEGNHDFNFFKLFKRTKVFARLPQLAEFEGKKVALAHGDVFLPKFTAFALGILRSKITIFLLDKINRLFFDKLYQNICNQQKLKKLYKKLENFDKIAQIRVKNYVKFFNLSPDIIIEGHFHQGQNYLIDGISYYNLDAFANERSFFVLECDGILKKFQLPKKE